MSDHMSGTDRLLLILHIGFAIFTLGPLTAATMATPRYIRRGDIGVLRYLRRVTQMYGLLSIAVFLFGMLLARCHFDKFWVTASMTLMIVALVLLLLVERDQIKAIRALQVAIADRPAAEPPAVNQAEPPADTPDEPAPKPAEPAVV